MLEREDYARRCSPLDTQQWSAARWAEDGVGYPGGQPAAGVSCVLSAAFAWHCLISLGCILTTVTIILSCGPV